MYYNIIYKKFHQDIFQSFEIYVLNAIILFPKHSVINCARQYSKSMCTMYGTSIFLIKIQICLLLRVTPQRRQSFLYYGESEMLLFMRE